MTPFPLWAPVARGLPGFILHFRVALAWPSFAPGSVYAQQVLYRMPSTVPAVPTCWSAQIADEVLALERSGATLRAQIDAFLTNLYHFQLVVDGELSQRMFGDILPFARTHALSVSDAAYLELAHRLNLPLATRDADLTRAANSAGVPLFTP